MRWILLLLVVFLVGCTTQLPDDLSSCTADEECMVVFGGSCCGCYNIINAKYAELWSNWDFGDCSRMVCEPCPPTPTQAKCIDGQCVPAVYDFESCVAEGYPIMESYPRQCQADGITHLEVVQLTLEEATEIALLSECAEKGTLTQGASYNYNSHTWWIGLDMKPEFENKLCNPACVISSITKTAEINWRCTGAVEEVSQQN